MPAVKADPGEGRLSRFAPPIAILLLSPSCTSHQQCSEEFWARRPAWAEQYSTVSHTSDDTSCSTTGECLHTLHICVNGRCRAWCDGDAYAREPGVPECPNEEKCVTEWKTDTLNHSPMGDICRGSADRPMSGPDPDPGWGNDRTVPLLGVGGVCLPNEWLDGGL